MATIRIGNVSADMRLTNDAYGISALKDFLNFVENFAPVSQQLLVNTPNFVVIRVTDMLSQTATLSLTGVVTSSMSGVPVTMHLTEVATEAQGVIEYDRGNMDANLVTGDLSGIITSLETKLTADGSLIGSVDGISLSVNENGLPIDPNALSGSDTIISGSGNDYLLGYAGDDAISAGVGNDGLEGGPGNDTLDGGPGDDMMNGGDGNDAYVVGDAGDTIADLSGTDTVQSYIPWLLADGLENLTLLGTASYGVGNAVANTMLGNGAANYLVGQGDADTIVGGGGDDWIEGESGNNPLPMGQVAGADNLSGGDGNDMILSGGGDDLVHGDAGDDTITGEAGNDMIYGDVGQDALDGGAGGDVLYGGVGVDIIFGDADGDTLYGAIRKM